MTDIVERLRAEIDPDVNEPLDRLLDEAADEIGMLRAAVEINTLRHVVIELANAQPQGEPSLIDAASKVLEAYGNADDGQEVKDALRDLDLEVMRAKAAQPQCAPIPEYWIKCPSCGFVGRDILSVTRPERCTPHE